MCAIHCRDWCNFFFQAEDGIRDTSVLEFRRVLFRSPGAFAPSTAQHRGSARLLVRREQARSTLTTHPRPVHHRSEERRVGKSVDLGGGRNSRKKKMICQVSFITRVNIRMTVVRLTTL